MNSFLTRYAPFAIAVALSGCVAAPIPVAPGNIPVVAIPGPTKTEAEFRQDDLTCRAAAVPLPPNPTSPTASQPAAAQQPEYPPGVAYLRCMASRQNTIEPYSIAQPVVYAYYPAYPIYAGIGYGYPYYYGGYASFGFYRLYGGGRYFAFHDGYRGGFRDGGYHGGGFRDGGYRGFGGGFRGGHR